MKRHQLADTVQQYKACMKRHQLADTVQQYKACMKRHHECHCDQLLFSLANVGWIKNQIGLMLLFSYSSITFHCVSC